MQKDLKIGMLAGAGIVLVGWILFALFSDSPQQRRFKQFETEPTNPAPQTVHSVPAPVPPLNPASPSLPTPQQNTSSLDNQPQIHIVQPGETLGSIAAQYYGNFSQWQKILDANQDSLQKPEQLKPGMRLKIPPK